MIYIFCALYHEAEPLIREYGLKKKTDETCFPVFFSEEENILLTVTGCGMNAATAAVARICTKRTPQPADFLVNIGTCAKVSYSKGSGQTCRNVSEKETAAGDGLHSSDKRKTVQEQSVKAGEVYPVSYTHLYVQYGTCIHADRKRRSGRCQKSFSGSKSGNRGCPSTDIGRNLYL